MRLLRSNLGVSVKDRIINEVIREEVVEELLLELIERHRLRWFGYLKSMSNLGCQGNTIRKGEDQVTGGIEE